ncbi:MULTISPECIES: type II toxin-antitoxin system prevent-host-death family antitoxin [unclassified Candidatus Tisiphia]|uniref:type II toxin-antitoxin system prevent-host-death family antitoxin n=1 Tax=unclassified Candidatus Tisiphia TaxID=2996318 RepID=UPI00312CA9A9
MQKWQLQEAKEHFEEIIELAENGQPQLINDKKRHKAVYIISVEDYMGDKIKPPMSFKEFLLSIPKVDNDDEEDLFERKPSKAREDIDI